MTASERLMFIRQKYDSLKGAVTTSETKQSTSATAATPSTAQSASSENKNTLVVDPQQRSQFTNSSTTEPSAAANSELLTKTKEALNHLQYVQNGLQDIQKYAESLKTNVSTSSPSTAAAATAATNSQQAKSQYFESPAQPPVPHIPEAFIEGFENVKSYASIF